MAASFNPGNVTITAGTTVQWLNTSGLTHTVTSAPSSTETFNQSVNSGSGGFSRQFNSPGTYEYYCTLHGTPDQGMVGSIIVGDEEWEPPEVRVAAEKKSGTLTVPGDYKTIQEAVDAAAGPSALYAVSRGSLTVESIPGVPQIRVRCEAASPLRIVGVAGIDDSELRRAEAVLARDGASRLAMGRTRRAAQLHRYGTGFEAPDQALVRGFDWARERSDEALIGVPGVGRSALVACPGDPGEGAWCFGAQACQSAAVQPRSMRPVWSCGKYPIDTSCPQRTSPASRSPAAAATPGASASSAFSSVVLPAPFRPMRTTFSPRFTMASKPGTTT